MNEIIENIKNFFKGMARAFRKFMGQDLSDAELLEDEYNNDYFYRNIHLFNELNPENQAILDSAMKTVLVEEKQVSMQEALRMAKKSKLKSNINTDKKNDMNKAIKDKKTIKERTNVDRDM